MESDAGALAAVRAIGVRYGVDYTDDAAVADLLAEHRRAVDATQRGGLVWIGGLTLTAGALWPFAAQLVPKLAAHLPLSYAPAGPLLLIAVAALTAVRVRWKRELTRGPLVGYREVLGVARAHGLPVTHVPAWLEGRSHGGTGKGATPVPTPTPTPTPTPAPAGGVERAPVDIPAKPAAVLSYEQIADEGGWHDEAGCLLLAAGAIGAGWAWANDQFAGLAALVLVPVAIRVWVAGSRQGQEKERLRQEALAYVRTVAAAQAAGGRAPELSPVLRRLLEEETQRGRAS
ncbi:hypothetical protein OG562_25180 [Streptomyces sp. NBC_01275]|uniref:hypothetical protein n=1 Tax=Streptomyces sp. NBC_01275 TaxID=2903807 RepID=UPI002257039E|nr:hypothetical protein [Streptomyces sp. NBC_01275]MCX4764192.1 hypothetical protein [Streptomyces sp. NBC_01275]